MGRPWGWAAHNLRELRVNCVWTAIRDYYRDPNSMTRDMMLTHAFDCEFEDMPFDDSGIASSRCFFFGVGKRSGGAKRSRSAEW